jgi:hypothetical protein
MTCAQNWHPAEAIAVAQENLKRKQERTDVNAERPHVERSP